MSGDALQLSFVDDSEEYKAFVDKFKPKKTTDDCYTPPEIFDVVADYVVKRYAIDRDSIVRPFWPDGDYEREDYPDGCAVVDNPPFSILSEIIDFYMRRDVKFFLFCPTLTAFSSRKHIMSTNHIICHTSITYANGAKVNTSFITNMGDGMTVVESAPELSDAINEMDEKLQKANKRQVGKYEYPDAVLTAAKVNWLSAHHTVYALRVEDCCPIAKLDAMNGKGIFGGGLLLSTRAAAERAAAERAAAERAAATKWQLSERELRIQKMLDEKIGGTQ